MKIEERNGKLVVTDFNELEAYKISCAVERNGILFYKKLASAQKKPEVQELLEFLQHEEERHLRFFEEHLAKLQAVTEDRFEDDDLISSINPGIFAPYENMGELENIIADLRKAVRLGIIVEDKSIQFYSACREMLNSAQTKQKLGEIIAEEMKHKELLETVVPGK